MRILFYSTSSNHYDGSLISSRSLPHWKESWQALAESHPQDKFIIASQLPAMFLFDLESSEISEKAPDIEYHLIQSTKEKEIALELSELKPDIALALSFYVTPYDWLPIKDAMTADYLRSMGIKSICHETESALICFDKWRTHLFLEKCGINCAKALYMHHELFINGGNRRELKSNVYRDALFHQLKKMNFPLIIKDTTGLSSFGADVVNNMEEARGILKSKKTSSDRIIEEMIAGDQFGTEIYGFKGNYTILPPFKFSVNHYGITSPKQSVKAGPFLEENPLHNQKYKLTQLKQMLLKLANDLNLNGIAQVDLVFDGEKWFVIEINPRLSGMSTSYAVSAGKFFSEMIYDNLIEGNFSQKDSSQKENLSQREKENLSQKENSSHKEERFLPCVNIKVPLMTEDMLKELYNEKCVFFVNQIENKAAKQLREGGYCEVILRAETKDELSLALEKIKEKQEE